MSVRNCPQYYETNSLFVFVPQFATVYKARDKTTDTIVAIKKVKVCDLSLSSTLGCSTSCIVIVYFPPRLKLAIELKQKMVCFDSFGRLRTIYITKQLCKDICPYLCLQVSTGLPSERSNYCKSSIIQILLGWIHIYLYYSCVSTC